ncbi:MAG TPA: glucose-6-phosphate dehydrogenase [Actinomycetales bacterium]|nr:glucose-6-phosphate dehydrogenase [Actinomycetales bacterium]
MAVTEDDQVRTLVVLGGTGDLAARLLLPGLGRLLDVEPHRRLRLVGSGTEAWDDERWRRRVRQSFDSAGARGAAVDAAVDGGAYVRADVTLVGDLRRVLDAAQGPMALYFALPPPVTVAACRALLEVDLPSGSRLVLEKPFGTDGDSAAALNALVTRLVREDRVHRVDHFLGKSTVLNILGLRFANRLLEPVWNADHVERVDVVFDETLGLEGRARYYDGAGALVDMIQSHLLQVLAFLAMEPPASVRAPDLRDRKADVLAACRVAGGDPVTSSRRSRWTAGRVGDRDLPGYADSEGVDPSRGTETLAEVLLEVDTPRWSGVPFLLRSGKAIGTARKEAVVTFKAASALPAGLHGTPQPTRLRIGFGPDGLVLELDVNGPGDPFELERVALRTDFGAGDLTAYGEVLAGVLDGDPTLSVRGDTAERCWRIIEPVLDAWRRDDVPLEEYPAGSTGPTPRPPFDPSPS